MSTHSLNALILLTALLIPFTISTVAASSPGHWNTPQPKDVRTCPQESTEAILDRTINACLDRNYDKGIALFNKYCLKDHSGSMSKKAALVKVFGEIEKKSTDTPANLSTLRKSLEHTLALDFFVNEMLLKFGFPTSDGCTLTLQRKTAQKP